MVMAQTTYEELFEEHLRSRIELGGDIGRMISCVQAYTGEDRTARLNEFRKWLETTVFQCMRCGRSFSPSTEEPEPARVICIACFREEYEAR
jgi:hypothetical protein